MKQLLIIEDFDFIRLDFVKKLKGHFQIFEAAETNEAKELINENDISIVVIDSKLRYTNPYDFIDELNKSHPNIRIIAFINSSNTEMLPLFSEHGVNEYIFKTDSAADLLLKLSC